MLVEGHLVKWLIIAKCVTLLKYCVNKKKKKKKKISLGIRVKKAWVLSYPLIAQQRLIRLGECAG